MSQSTAVAAVSSDLPSGVLLFNAQASNAAKANRGAYIEVDGEFAGYITKSGKAAT